MKKVILLGASGSIGQQTIDILRNHTQEFRLEAVSVGNNVSYLKEILNEFTTIRYVYLKDKIKCKELQSLYSNIKFYYGDNGLTLLCNDSDYDIMVNALVGFIGLNPTLIALKKNKICALANKESLVVGGPLILDLLKQEKGKLYPIDSEHSAIFQALQGEDKKQIDKLIITASGGSLRHLKRSQLTHITPEQALNHPNWKMGGRITIDSSTMLNKGFEVIEAHYLFQIPYSKIEVIIHKESVIHSMVQFCDSAIMAQLGTADMRVPIQYALSYPNRIPLMQANSLSFEKVSQLNFENIDFQRYPLLKVAYEVGKKGGNYGAVLNAADEVAVELFLNNKINFLSIESYIINALKQAEYIENPTLDELKATDEWARACVLDQYKEDLQ